MRRPLLAVFLALMAAPADAGVQFSRHVGVEFDHFGESYRITDEQDTVATINDIGTVLGVSLRTPLDRERRLRLDADVHVGQETRRVRMEFDGRLRWGAQTFDLSHDARYRWFGNSSEYSVVGNLFEDSIRLACQRDFAERWRVRVRSDFDIAAYAEPNEYNRDSWQLRPGLDARMRFGDLSEVGLGYRLGKRSVRDSTELDYWRHTVDADLSALFGWTASLDVIEQIDRRVYDPISTRESSWEHHFDLRFGFDVVEHATLRLIHENEVVRYDHPDELDFDFVRARTGAQVEVHRSRQMDLSLMPLYSFLTSETSPEEEFTETGLEVGMDWRVGSRLWINVANEVGRRDYEVTATETPLVVGDTPSNTAAGDFSDTAFSDYIYNRFTATVTSDFAAGVSFHLFVNWEPQDHRLDRHDTNTRIVSGGAEYRF